MELLIRIGELKDLDVLVKFNQALVYETEGKQLPLDVVTAGVETLLTRPNLGFYLLAEKNANVAGSLMITTEWSDWRNGLYWWIQSVYIRPEFRRQGIYRKLYEFVKQKAYSEQNELRVCGFKLYVERHNTVAQKAYQALGMKESYYTIYEEL
ncbi:GNAT family N-acetyltransferase [Aetokthonos hydrillicola Thurmond2011]|jgi:ribosomal protein S18 acetylase RimI-like enzyme|uniref:GNAT family N-acetyltransferase n=1 Tax=Aetokthonos hydrillicola Thurmond2011 TaxID=2712845 RepID=A0AAP5IHE5_9CYAN|nr:GNAT family N-acetyltransferase [Aetokthonos hydrillicola]MBO3459763.1 GNAT family N-acetyltransferase [Aetokthonos hydrillicola CCALA 1050]MBW4585196.1 GNAT family N-acetyltransferase [Aetokthonos hydrillicola CCALA 1050]MDR9899535.1 GNAT family N-acetyltransferase [Aetokthonos hydrillicola Thurmond2011]